MFTLRAVIDEYKFDKKLTPGPLTTALASSFGILTSLALDPPGNPIFANASILRINPDSR